jgi:hypothetical protein
MRNASNNTTVTSSSSRTDDLAATCHRGAMDGQQIAIEVGGASRQSCPPAPGCAPMGSPSLFRKCASANKTWGTVVVPSCIGRIPTILNSHGRRTRFADGPEVRLELIHLIAKPNRQICLEKQFSSEQLTRILQQAAVYMCACPAQVCQAISQQRHLFAYQADCISSTDSDYAVHLRIAETVQITHAELEVCLRDVLQLEGWDMVTLAMPRNLQKRMLASLTEDEGDGKKIL